MKRFLLFFALTGFMFSTASAQTPESKAKLNELLGKYYEMKNALVADSVAGAAAASRSFIMALNGVPYTLISEQNASSLIDDASSILKGDNINEQRNAFSNLTGNMFNIVKAIPFADKPIYRQYCPMKKKYWLSSDTAILNPYYGSEMLTCGKVVDEIK